MKNESCEIHTKVVGFSGSGGMHMQMMMMIAPKKK